MSRPSVSAALLRLGALLQSDDDGVLLVDAGGIVVHATPSVGRLLGVPETAILSQPLTAIPLGGESGALAAAWRDVREHGRASAMVAGPAAADGSGPRTLELRGRDLLAVRDVAAVAFILRDVTGQAAALRALRDSEQRYRRLVENAGDIIFQCDTEGRFTFVNRTASTVMGYSLQDLLGRHFTELVRADYRERLVTLYLAQRDERLPDTYVEFPAVTKGGDELWIGQHVQVVTEGDRVVGVQAVARDMTERRRFEEQLQEARRLEAIGTLAGGVAHDFNNLLQAIRGNAELALLRLGADVAGADVQTILDASDRGAALVRQLLAFGRRQPMRPVTLHVGDAIASVCADWVSIFRRGIDLDVRCDETVLPVRFDPVQFEQVMVNLLLNARDAMPQGGPLIIEAGNVQMSTALRERLQVTLPGGPFVRIAVTDTGEGMSAETLRHVFEPFFTTKAQGKGIGLGLSSAYGIVTQSGGHIEVESRLGEGSRFTVYLPAAEPAQPLVP